MALQLDVQRLQYAFQGREDLIGAIKIAAGAPNWIELFNEITAYVSDLRKSSESSEPASKKRKIDSELPLNPKGVSNGAAATNGSSQNGGAAQAGSREEGPSLLQIQDISFTLPVRKKLTVEFTTTHIKVLDNKTKEVIPGASSYAWKDIAYAFCVPVPEKTASQFNYILFPSNSQIPLKDRPSSDPIVLTIPDTAPIKGSITGPDASTAASFSDSYKMLFEYYISEALKGAGNNVSIVEPNEKQFHSMIKEAHRPNKKATFVKGFRGSKDGYLFFLSTGILFGFKKPLIFLPKEQIIAVSYTNVLQRTFNLNVEVYTSLDAANTKDSNPDDEDGKEEFEFAMLDQEDFDGIDTYIKRHGLQDASMAEQRKAKRLGINTVKGENGEVVDTGDAGELEKAQLELEDEEDEEEEDYDPGSDGESEGSGSSDDDDDDDDDDDGGGGGGDEEEMDDDEAAGDDGEDD